MEGNRDASDQCIARARACLRNGDLAGAEKFANKSERLFPNATAKGLLAAVDSRRKMEAEGASSSNAKKATASASAAGVRRRKTATSKSSEQQQKQAKKVDNRPFTREQQEMVTTVLSATTLYERLSVTKTADGKTIKKAYRKLALKLHPDKNSAPRAEDAFRAVNGAYQILSDDQKRRHYDLTGREPNERPQRGHGHQFDPNDIFAQFAAQHFGQGFGGQTGFFFRNFDNQYPRQGFQRQRPRQRHRHQRQEQEVHGLFGLMPALVMIFALTVFSSMFSSTDQVFSLGRTEDFHILKYTHTEPAVEFYVADSYHNDYELRGTRAQMNIEQEVVNAKIHSLENRCQREVQRQRREILAGRRRQLSRAEVVKQYPAESCDELRDLRKARFVRFPSQQQHQQQRTRGA